MRNTLLVLALTYPTFAQAEEPASPTPPRQAEAWTAPPSRLPRFLVKATAALFDQGLADPRGCDYRQVWIEVGSGWVGELREVATTGWVLPSADGVARHAVAWNGLVYPLSGSGGPADLDADVRALPVVGGEGRMILPRGRLGDLNGIGWFDEASGLALASAGPLEVCLLLRLGRADLAEAAWANRHPLPEVGGERPKLDLKTYGVSYLSLATDLALSRFTRAVNAHLRGDDPLALADARALVALDAAVEARASAMGFARSARPTPPGQVPHYLDFLDQAPRLLADQERRARERSDLPRPPTGEGAPARVAGLIRDLDQVVVRPQFQFGGVNLIASPVVGALAAEGDAAVEPLLEVVRSDGRLTRSGGPTILGVEHAACTALAKIIPGLPFNPPAPDAPEIGPRSRRGIAEAIRIRWQATRASPPVRR